MEGPSREDLYFLANCQEQAERYDDMLETMKVILKMGEGLSIPERNLLSLGYKRAVSDRRVASRVLEWRRYKENDPAKLEMLVRYLDNIESEGREICREFVETIDQQVLPYATAGEDIMFLKKTKGDFYRYWSEFSKDDERREINRLAHEAYTEAEENELLPPTHPIRLGMQLSRATFSYEILNEPALACEIAKKAFDAAIAELDTLSEDEVSLVFIVCLTSSTKILHY